MPYLTTLSGRASAAGAARRVVRQPVIGWLDEVASLAVLVQKMSKYITPEMEVRADEQLDRWFPEDAEYELIEG
ncbi:MAG: hypothetical protein K2K97_04110 [Muribaculaceae bacterium]|nr:hypothetical protein [Muribaculaceae bacterium]